MRYQLYNYSDFATGAQPEDCVLETRGLNECYSAMCKMMRAKPKKRHFHIFGVQEGKIVTKRVAE